MKLVRHRMLGLCAFVAALYGLSACGSDEDNGNGNQGAGNSTAKGGSGPKGSGGSSSTSGGTTSSSGGKTSTADGKAVAKFCNLLAGANNQPLTLKLTITSGGSDIELSAASGECAPPAPAPCTNISSGAVGLKLSSGDEVVAEGSIPSVADGDEVLILATIDENAEEPAPTVQAGKLKPEYKCSDVTLDEEGEGGAGGAGPSVGGAGGKSAAGAGGVGIPAGGKSGIGGTGAGGKGIDSFDQRRSSRSWFETIAHSFKR